MGLMSLERYSYRHDTIFLRHLGDLSLTIDCRHQVLHPDGKDRRLFPIEIQRSSDKKKWQFSRVKVWKKRTGE